MTPVQEFLILITFGTADNPLVRWFTDFAAENMLQKVEKALESSTETLVSIILNSLQRHLEHVVFRLTELKNYSFWKERFESLRILDSSLQKMIAKISTILPLTFSILNEVSLAKRDYREFLNWMKESKHNQFKPNQTKPNQTNK